MQINFFLFEVNINVLVSAWFQYPCHVSTTIINLKGLAHAKSIKKSVILFRVLNMTIWCKHVHRLELQIFVLRIHQLG